MGATPEAIRKLLDELEAKRTAPLAQHAFESVFFPIHAV
jgi:hypothetical protein